MNLEGIREEIERKMGHKESGNCNCFACSLRGVLRYKDDMIETEKLKVAIHGLAQSFGMEEEYHDDIMFLRGICYGIMISLDTMNVPAFITKEPELIQSLIEHLMRTNVKQSASLLSLLKKAGFKK